MNDLLEAGLTTLIRRTTCIEELLVTARTKSRLTAKCAEVTGFLEQSRRDATQALNLLSTSPQLLGDLARQYNATARDVYLIEQLVVGPLSRFCADDEKLCRVCERICGETAINDVPVIVAAGTQYFSALPDYGLILTPPSEFRSLLNLPDIYHELGHHVHGRIKPLVGARFVQAYQTYISETDDEVARLSRPVDIARFHDLMVYWSRWALEVAADAFATLLVGPSYGWANFHLMLRVPSIFRFSPTHPADAARMEFILRLLRSDHRAHAGVDALEQRWKRYRELDHPSPPELYDVLHPPQLFTAALDDVRAAIDELHLVCDPFAAGTLAALLNQAWEKLIAEPQDFADWEAISVAANLV